MPKVSDAHRESRRTQIVQAALRCFAEKGFQRTSMADIIAASGLSAGAIYLQFDSKQDIVIAAARETIGHRIDDVAARLAEPPLPDPDELIAVIMGGMARDAPTPQLLVQLWGESFFTGEMGALVDVVFGRLRDTMADYLARWAIERRGLSPAEAEDWGRATAPALLGLVQGHILQSAILDDFDPATYRTAVRNLFL